MNTPPQDHSSILREIAALDRKLNALLDEISFWKGVISPFGILAGVAAAQELLKLLMQ